MWSGPTPPNIMTFNWPIQIPYLRTLFINIFFGGKGSFQFGLWIYSLYPGVKANIYVYSALVFYLLFCVFIGLFRHITALYLLMTFDQALLKTPLSLFIFTFDLPCIPASYFTANSLNAALCKYLYWRIRLQSFATWTTHHFIPSTFRSWDWPIRLTARSKWPGLAFHRLFPLLKTGW